jgi:type IV secretion system protein VirB6
MITACPIPTAEGEFVRPMVDFIDCQAQSLGSGAWQTLAAPGSTLALVLTGFITLFVALFGYRMLFGHVPSIRDGVLALVKIGIVLALATSWPAYRILIYDVALRGPAELAADIGAPTGLPGAGGGLVDRLDIVDKGLAALAVLGTGDPPPDLAGQQAATQAAALGNAPPPFLGFNNFALGGARLLFLLGAIGGLAAVRLTAGLMLALGPFFIAFLLFDNTRSLFEGWLRVLAGAALGALGIAIALGIELSLLEPWLADAITRRAAGEYLPNMPAELLVISLIVAIALVAMIAAAGRAAYGFRLAPSWRSAASGAATLLRSGDTRIAAPATAPGAAAAEGRSRAVSVADAVASAQRRETAQAALGAGAGSFAAADPRRAVSHAPMRDTGQALAPIPLGRSFARRTTGRVSAVAGRRDRSS